MPGSTILLSASTLIAKNVYQQGFAPHATERQITLIAKSVLPLFALLAVYFVLRGGATFVALALFASSLLTQLFPSFFFSLLPRRFGNKYAAVAGIFAGGAVLGAITLSGKGLAAWLPGWPLAVQSLNPGLVALAINLAVFLAVGTLTQNRATVPAARALST